MSGRSILARIAELEDGGATAAVVTVVHTSGSTPREAGARMIVHPGGALEGTIGGGRIEQEATAEALAALGDGRPRFLEYALTQELGMCCGGKVALFVEVIGHAPRLVVFGAGHVGAALTRMAAQAGFVVHVADERDELCDPRRLAEARSLHLDLDDPALPFSADTFVMVTTHDHALDQRIVEKVLKKPHRWLGLIGSRRKAELTRQRLAHKGFTDAEIARVRCPVGLAIGAETPEEIAVSILAELVAARRGVAPARASDDGLVATLEAKTPRRTP
ncbi:xanthine dehydrogenase accessory protein XdhC [Myxococcota bacterium]|nr:xanthine dehydrogenase accessory protein XdhC [Myxococcota bacterium]